MIVVILARDREIREVACSGCVWKVEKTVFSEIFDVTCERKGSFWSEQMSGWNTGFGREGIWFYMFMFEISFRLSHGNVERAVGYMSLEFKQEFWANT